MRSMSTPAGQATRRLVLAVTAVAMLLVTAPVALADAPSREFLPAGTIEFAPGETCAFGVTIDFPANNEYATTFTLRSGATWVHIAGRLVVTVSHGTKSVELNISGPGRTVSNPDGSATMLFLGNSMIFDRGYMLLTHGPAVLEIAPDGSIASYDITSARVLDVCALIA